MTTADILTYTKIALHVANPDIDDVYSEGYEAAKNREDESSNPYQVNHDNHEYWSQGWWAGFYNQPQLNESNIPIDMLVKCCESRQDRAHKTTLHLANESYTNQSSSIKSTM